jgi:hypothetical protein
MDQQSAPKQSYATPVLKHLGALTTITQAGSMGNLEMGAMSTNLMMLRP